MDELDQLRTDHSREMLAKGRAELTTNPELGFYHIWSSRLLIISMCLKASGDVPKTDVLEFIRELNSIIFAHSINLHIEKQNDLLILALAAEDVVGAIELAQTTCRENTSHKFDRLLNHQLRSTLIPNITNNALNYRPTKSEQLLFDDFARIRESKDCDLSGIDSYWRATKSHRYQNTMFQHVNLFRLAFEVLRTQIHTGRRPKTG